MSVLFISHSSQDNDQAIKVRDWLRSNGWSEVFLDLDPAHGLAPGQRWQDELKRAGEDCAAVVVLVSPSWVASRWCQTEFLVADQLGKRIFPVFVAPTSFDDLPLELKAKFQLADISTLEKETEGFQRLAIGLKRAGLDPTSFDWPPANEPARSVYRGLQALDVQDAAIFFGRDAAITRGLDELRKLRDGASQRVLVILGASGAGKSSFLRAGLLARLKRDEENFLVLPVVRPERAVMSGPQGLLASISKALGRTTSLTDAASFCQALVDLREPVVERLTRNAEAARETNMLKPPTIVLPLDQAEELFAAENVERNAFHEALTSVVKEDGNVIVIATIRSDSYEPLQNGWLPDKQRTFSLPAIAAGSFQEIIEGPARLAKPPLTIEPELTQQLLGDLSAADALPLLAFTLERLQRQYGGDGKLTLADYRDKLGGLGGAIQSAVDAALGEQPSKEKLNLARGLFVPALVQVNQEGVKRRLARRAELPAESDQLLDDFLKQGLLIRDGDFIELAHEAVFRHWPALASWIAEERGALAILDGVRSAAREWRHRAADARGQDDWLVHAGSRLADADAVVHRSDFARGVNSEQTTYLAECRKAERRRIARSRGLRRIATVAVIATVVVLLTATGLVSRMISEQLRGASAQVANLAAQAADAENFDRAARYALTGLSLASFPILGVPGSESELELRRALAGPMLSEHSVSEEPVVAIDYQAERSLVLTAAGDQVIVWRLPEWEVVSTLTMEGRATDVVFSPSGDQVISASMDGVVHVWSFGSAAPPVRLTAPEMCRAFASVVIANDARLIAAACRSPAEGRQTLAVVWRRGRDDAPWGAPQALVGSGGPSTAIDVSPDGRRLAVTRSFENSETRANSQVEIWRATDTEAWTRSGQIRPISRNAELRAARFDPGGQMVVAASSDGSANIWSVGLCEQSPTCMELTRLRESGQIALNVVAYSRRGDLVLTAGREGVVDITDMGRDTDATVITLFFNPDAGAITDAVFGDDGTSLITGTAAGQVQVWRLDRADRTLLSSPDAGFAWATFGQRGEILTAENRNDRSFEVALSALTGDREGQREVITSGRDAEISSVHCSESCLVAALVAEARTIQIVARDDAGRWRDEDWPGANLAVWNDVVSVSRDGSRIAIWSVRDRAIVIFERIAGAWRQTAALTREFRVDVLQFGQDSDTLVAAAADGSVRVISLSSLEELPLEGSRSAINSIEINLSGDMIATASRDNTIRLWRREGGVWRGLGALRGHNNAVTVLAFDTSGVRLASGSLDQTIRVWDTSSRRELWRTSVADEMFGVSFSDGDLSVVALAPSGIYRLLLPASLSMDRRSLVASACATILSGDNDRLSEAELDSAPVLDRSLDAEACARPGPLSRLRAALGG